jgi:exopolyphosphatase / guanosine-5'-triphosphate,3'-diphosphate pyrophosphatase
VRCACVDIGSNTTRLLVADHVGGPVAPVLQLRVFTRLGRACGAGGALAPDVVGELAEVVAAQVAAAHAEGAQALRVVATAAVRRAANGAEVCAALRAAAGVEVELLSGEEEARLAFEGATAAEAIDPAATVGVVDVGGGSSELIAGTRTGGVSWMRSLAIGSGDLAAAHLHADPPTVAQLDAVRAQIARALASVEPPPVAHAFAVGGSATSLRRLAGPLLDPGALARAIDELTAGPAAAVAARWELDPVRVRLLPAGILLLAAVAARLGPLTIAKGGLREGVVMALARG